MKPSFPLTRNILIGMLAGILLGIWFQNWPDSGFKLWVNDFVVEGVLWVGGKVFVSTLKVMVVPLVLVSLIGGVASLKDASSFGRIGFHTISLYILTTAFAIVLAMLLATVIEPGVGFQVTLKEGLELKAVPPIREVLANIFPDNPIAAMAEANMLQVIVIAILFGLAMVNTPVHGPRLLSWIEDMNQVVMSLILMLMHLAPLGVFCLIARVFAAEGLSAIAPLFKYFMVVVLGLVFHVAITYTALLRFWGGLRPWQFFKKFRSVPGFAFSTASSGATIPVTLEVVEERLGVHNSIASFAIPLGATINMDGTAIMQGVATVFIAQSYQVDLGWSGYLTVIGMATLASIGTAAVPGVGLITLTMVLQQVGLPIEAIGTILGVDRLLDMLRTAVNVTGDAAVACVVARRENLLDESVFEAD